MGKVKKKKKGQRVYPKNLTCPGCDQLFSFQSHLDTHMIKHTGEEKHECPHCHTMFKWKMSLERHIKFHCLNPQPIICKHKCPHCDKAYEAKFHLNQHINAVHKAKKPFECQVCGKRLAYKLSLKRHLETHTNPKVHGYRSANKHLKRLAKERAKLTCKVCGTSCKSQDSLNSHMETHPSGTVPCPKCGENFPTTAARSRHMVDNGCMFDCKECGDVFLLEEHLDAHTQTHQLSGLPCIRCGEEFESLALLNLHKQADLCVAVEPTLEECGQCGRFFPNKGELDTHIVDMHDVSTNTLRFKVSTTRKPKKALPSTKCLVCRAEPDFKSSLADRFRPKGMRYVCPKCDVVLLESEHNFEEYFRKAAIIMHSW